MANHTLEPWKLSGITPLNICDTTGTLIADACSGWQSEEGIREANARRIVACVNACAGIPTEALESGEARQVRDELANIDSIERKNDTLIEALEKIINLNNTENDEWDAVERVIPEMIKIAEEALSK